MTSRFVSSELPEESVRQVDARLLEPAGLNVTHYEFPYRKYATLDGGIMNGTVVFHPTVHPKLTPASSDYHLFHPFQATHRLSQIAVKKADLAGVEFNFANDAHIKKLYEAIGIIGVSGVSVDRDLPVDSVGFKMLVGGRVPVRVDEDVRVGDCLVVDLPDPEGMGVEDHLRVIAFRRSDGVGSHVFKRIEQLGTPGSVDGFIAHEYMILGYALHDAKKGEVVATRM